MEARVSLVSIYIYHNRSIYSDMYVYMYIIINTCNAVSLQVIFVNISLFYESDCDICFYFESPKCKIISYIPTFTIVFMTRIFSAYMPINQRDALLS